MTITLGSVTLIVDWDGIESRYFKNTAKHSLLGATDSKRQYLGKDSNQYKIKGIFEGASKDTDMQTIRNYYLNNTEVSFSGYTTSAVNVRIIEIVEKDFFTYWEYDLVVEETGT